METSKPKSDMGEQASSLAGSAVTLGSQELLPEKSPEHSEQSSSVGQSPLLTINNEPLTNEFQPEVDLEKPPGGPRGDEESMKFEEGDEDPAVPVSFQRTSSPAALQRNKNAAYEKVGEDCINRMYKYSLYETAHRFYLIGADFLDKQYRVLKIDRTAPPGQ